MLSNHTHIKKGKACNGPRRKSASVTSSKRCRAGARVCLHARQRFKTKKKRAAGYTPGESKRYLSQATAELSNACACTHVKRKKQSIQKQRGVTHTIAAVETSGASLRAARIATRRESDRMTCTHDYLFALKHMGRAERCLHRSAQARTC